MPIRRCRSHSLRRRPGRRGVARLLAASHIVRFATIGALSTLAYALLFVALDGAVGSGAANALVLTAVANTQANRRFIFGVRGRERLLRQHAAGAIVYLLALAVTTAGLLTLHALDAHPARIAEVAVLVTAGITATLTRYLGLRLWVFTQRSGGAERSEASADSGGDVSIAGAGIRRARLSSPP
jgi:putative flippase GtrA